MNGNSTRLVKIEADGDGVVAHVGLHALGAFADGLGLGDALSARIPPPGERLPLHDRGKVLTQAMLMLAGGGEACSDIEALRAQARLFGPVPSDSTLYRTFRHQLDAATLAGLWEAMAEVRARVWRRSSVTNTAQPIVLDIDATLVEVHSENKEGTAPTYKRGFGFHPMLCFADATGEALAARLRPGNAGANTVTDHLGVLDDAVAQLPAEVAAGHRPGDPAGDVARPVVVRADSAGCTHGFVWDCRERNIGFAVVARSNRQVAAAISRTYTETGPARWAPARRQGGEVRDGAQVAELTDLVDLSDWPAGTRLIVRREPLHPGAQQTLLPSTQFRYWGHYTDQAGDPVTLDATMRAHAHVEDHIRSRPGAAASLREGLEETLTLTRLGIRGTLKQTLESTNPCESMIECVRRSARNVKRWQSGDLALRWTAAGMLEAERQFRRIIGYRDLAKLATAVEREIAQTITKPPTEEAVIVATA